VELLKHGHISFLATERVPIQAVISRAGFTWTPNEVVKGKPGANLEILVMLTVR